MKISNEVGIKTPTNQTDFYRTIIVANGINKYLYKKKKECLTVVASYTLCFHAVILLFRTGESGHRIVNVSIEYN